MPTGSFTVLETASATVAAAMSATTLIVPSGFFGATGVSFRSGGNGLGPSQPRNPSRQETVRTGTHTGTQQGMATKRHRDRAELIVSTLEDAFAPLMEADPAAFRGKFRRMASDPHAFYRGSACLFYADVTGADDPFVDEESSRIWVHGDLHVENFGTYLNSDGVLVFDVNDFDEAYLGRFTWDLQRFAASLALVGWQKALPEDDVRRLIARYARAYLAQVDEYEHEEDDDFALHLDNTDGPIHEALVMARRMRRADLLEDATVRDGGDRWLREDESTRNSASVSALGWCRRTRPTWSRYRGPSARNGRSSTTFATWSARPGSASAPRGCRRTTC